MEKRYQIFVSSTYTDLQDERKAIIQSLLSAKYIPAGMEMFSASNDEQFRYIKKIIDNCDYYVLIVGARYGSINSETGISFTEQEYDYALKKNIPVLVFLHNDPFNLPEDKRDDDNRDLLIKFREKVSKSRLCKMWHSSSELVANVIISLNEEVDVNPQLGWIRGNDQDSTELLIQINDLRIKNDQYEKEIERLKGLVQERSFKVENLSSGSDKYIVMGFFQELSGDSDILPHYEYFEIGHETSWDDLFSLVGPYLYSPCEFNIFAEKLRIALNSQRPEKIAFSSINSDCIQTIKIQLCALNLVEIEAKAGREFIKLSEYGSNYLIHLKSIKKQ